MFAYSRGHELTAEQKVAAALEAGAAVSAALDGRDLQIARFVLGRLWIELCDAACVDPVASLQLMLGAIAAEGGSKTIR